MILQAANKKYICIRITEAIEKFKPTFQVILIFLLLMNPV
jgi:hypothetical protein